MIIDVDKLTPADYERARKKIEDILIDFRDSRISFMRNNGLVVKEYDGEPSSVIRMSIEECLRIGLRELASDDESIILERDANLARAAEMERRYDRLTLDIERLVGERDQARATAWAEIRKHRLNEGGSPKHTPREIRNLVACPTCNAPIGKPCRTLTDGLPCDNHKARTI